MSGLSITSSSLPATKGSGVRVAPRRRPGCQEEAERREGKDAVDHARRLLACIAGSVKGMQQPQTFVVGHVIAPLLSDDRGSPLWRKSRPLRMISRSSAIRVDLCPQTDMRHCSPAARPNTGYPCDAASSQQGSLLGHSLAWKAELFRSRSGLARVVAL